MVALAKGHQRLNLQAWHVQAQDYPKGGTRDEQMKFLVRYALLAANSHNTQPWKFQVKKDSTIELYWDEERALPLSDPQQRQGMISLGCTIGNLVVAGEHFGFAAEVTSRRDWEPALPVATLHMEPTPSDGSHGALFDAIPKRRMNRFPYTQRPISDDILAMLRAVSHVEEVSISFVSEPLLRDVLLSAVYHSTVGTQGNMDIVKEWSAWMRPRNTPLYDGIPLTEDFGFPGPSSLIAPFVWKVTPGTWQARNTQKLFSTAPVFFVLSGLDTQESWLRTGRALTYLGLATTVHGISYAPWGAVVEHERSAELVHDVLHLSPTERVLFFGRLGYAKKVPPVHSPRRPVEDVLREHEYTSFESSATEIQV